MRDNQHDLILAAGVRPWSVDVREGKGWGKGCLKGPGERLDEIE
jgi:hypothetical protein